MTSVIWQIVEHCVRTTGYNPHDARVVMWLQSCESSALMLRWAETNGSMVVTGDTKQACMMSVRPQSYGLMQFVQQLLPAKACSLINALPKPDA